jgi:hypothetical protein
MNTTSAFICSPTNPILRTAESNSPKKLGELSSSSALCSTAAFLTSAGWAAFAPSALCAVVVTTFFGAETTVALLREAFRLFCFAFRDLLYSFARVLMLFLSELK